MGLNNNNEISTESLSEMMNSKSDNNQKKTNNNFSNNFEERKQGKKNSNKKLGPKSKEKRDEAGLENESDSREHNSISGKGNFGIGANIHSSEESSVDSILDSIKLIEDSFNMENRKKDKKKVNHRAFDDYSNKIFSKKDNINIQKQSESTTNVEKIINDTVVS